jgi:hypothetical protein
MRFAPTVVTAFLVLSGCVGGVEDINPPGNSGPDAGTTTTNKMGKASYVANVHAVVMKCSGAGCHSQTGVTGMYGFAIPDASASYEEVIKLPTLVGTYTAASAQLITKFTTTPPHKAVVYSADDKAKINAWFAAELADRNTGGGGGTPPPPVIDAAAKLREWSGCMKLADFNTAQMAQKWALLASVDNKSCKSCHGSGAFSFMSGNGTPDIFFTTITTEKDLLLKYFTVDGTGQVIINTAAFNNAAVALPAAGTSNHPRFNPTTNVGMDALKLFYDATKLNQTAATCDPPRLPL